MSLCYFYNRCMSLQQKEYIIMGDQLSCCNAKAQFQNSLGQQVFTPTTANQHIINNKMPNLNFPPMTQKLRQLVERAQKNKYFKAKDKPMTNPKEIVIYGSGNQSALYEGQTVHNTAEGYGTVSFPNGSYFQGLFLKGQPVNGIFIFNESCYYAGDIQNFQASGDGLYENIQNGYYFEGKWKKNLQHGQGIQKYSNTDYYQGGFMCGSKFGEGEYKFADGKVYKGSFYNGHSDGFGKLMLPNGDSYEGDWKLGQMHGHGVYKWKNGQKYEGEYVNGVRQNKGKYSYSNGALYDGQWLNGLQEGEGAIKEGYDQVFGKWQAGEKIN